MNDEGLLTPPETSARQQERNGLLTPTGQAQGTTPTSLFDLARQRERNGLLTPIGQVQGTAPTSLFDLARQQERNGLLTPIGQAQGTTPTSLFDLARQREQNGLSALAEQEEDTAPRRAIKVKASHRSPKGVAGFDDRHLTESEMVEEPTAVQGNKNWRKSDTSPLPALRLRYVMFRGNDLHRQVGTHHVKRKATKSSERGGEAEASSEHSLWQRVKATDRWLIATFLLACIAGGFSLWYYFELHQTLLYGDANAHLLIARRVFDNLTPGLAQLGGIWLPLPHVLMFPLVWNDFLWRTGLAGSIVSMLSYLVSTVYIFLLARRLTRNSMISFVGTLVFILNPNMLYLQTTPLSELVLVATLSATCYYFLVWAQTDSLKYLILTASAMVLTTLSRYDGWFVFVVILLCICLIGLVRRHRLAQIEGNVFLFGSLGGLGIVLWLIWNLLIFGDPLYFEHSPFSSQAQQNYLLALHILFTYHDLFQSIRFYLIDCMDTVGPVLFGIGVLGLLVFLAQNRLKPETFAALVAWSPIPFYVISLYTGQAALYVPTAVPGYSPYTLYNARYGEGVVMPVALFLACLLSFLWRYQQRLIPWRFLERRARRTVKYAALALFFIGMIVGQSVWIVNTGIITLQDGEYGLACAHTHGIVIYMAQHYNGGKILEDLYTSKIDTLEPTVGIDFKNMIYEGSGQLWTEALSQPQTVVDWIIVNQNNPDDAITEKINRNTFTSHFSFILQEPNGLALYQRNNLPALPTYAVARNVFTDHQLCEKYNPGQFSNIPGLQPLGEVIPTGIQRENSQS